MIRAAAKNHASGGRLAGELRRRAGGARRAGKLSARTRESLASEAFPTPRYDTAISRWFGEREEDFPTQYMRSFEKVLDLAYGENPHQRAAFYAEIGGPLAPAVDGVEAAREGAVVQQPARPRLGPAPVQDFELPAAAIIKHNNPCGAPAGTTGDAFERALACDPQSAFGGVICFNRRVDRAARRKLHSMFVEHRRARLRRRALECSSRSRTCGCSRTRSAAMTIAEHDFKRVRGGVLVQDRDTGLEERGDMKW